MCRKVIQLSLGSFFSIIWRNKWYSGRFCLSDAGMWFLLRLSEMNTDTFEHKRSAERKIKPWISFFFLTLPTFSFCEWILQQPIQFEKKFKKRPTQWKPQKEEEVWRCVRFPWRFAIINDFMNMRTGEGGRPIYNSTLKQVKYVRQQQDPKLCTSSCGNKRSDIYQEQSSANDGKKTV